MERQHLFKSRCQLRQIAGHAEGDTKHPRCNSREFELNAAGANRQHDMMYVKHQALSSPQTLACSLQRRGEGGLFCGGHRHFNLRMTAQLSRLQSALEGQI